MKATALLKDILKNPRNLIKDHDGQLYCAITELNELNTKLNAYYNKLTFTNDSIQETKDYWIEEIALRLKDVAGAEDQISSVLERYNNEWDGQYASIGSKWHNQGLNQEQDDEWRNSIWYLLNISTKEEDKVLNEIDLQGTFFTIDQILHWQRDKEIILDFHYQHLLQNLHAKLNDTIQSSSHRQLASNTSIEQYKVAFLIYTKLRSFNWTHNDIKKGVSRTCPTYAQKYG